MTSAACDKLHLFLGGELTPAEGEAFRDHLGSCEVCARSLHDQMMIEALEQTSRPRRARRILRAVLASSGAQPRDGARRHRAAAGGGGLDGLGP